MSKFWLKDTIKGPIPFVSVPEAASIDEIVEDHYITLVTGLRSVYEQFSMRKYHTAQSQEKSYLRNPVNGQQIKPFKVDIPSGQELNKRKRQERDDTGRNFTNLCRFASLFSLFRK